MKELNSNRGETKQNTTVQALFLCCYLDHFASSCETDLFLKLQGAFTSNHGYCYKTVQEK